MLLLLRDLTPRRLWDWVQLNVPDEAECVIEKVGGYIRSKDGGFVAGSSAMFNFGRNYGELVMCLTAAEVPFTEVPPQTWQKAMAIPPRRKGESRNSFKNRLKDKACELYPRVKVTLATADALLIAEYSRRTFE